MDNDYRIHHNGDVEQVYNRWFIQSIIDYALLAIDHWNKKKQKKLIYFLIASLVIWHTTMDNSRIHQNGDVAKVRTVTVTRNITDR